MQKQYRLKKKGTFQYVYRRGSSTACREMVLLYTKSRNIKIGFSVSKKVGNSVTRNLIKRRLRECFREQIGNIKGGNYVIIARPAILNISYSRLQQQIIYLLSKQDLFIK
ncbi:MAG: ribonuclease P protein component [Eubacteriales bacterium]|nr:ribonuclease P protein component [Eubacteriales bacterium]